MEIYRYLIFLNSPITLHFLILFLGTLTVFNAYPTFCASGPVASTPANTKGVVATCVADRNNRNCTVNIRANNCGIHDSNQFFFTIDPVPGTLFDTSRLALPTDPTT